MAATGHRWADTKSVDAMHLSWRRRRTSFFVATLLLTCLAGGAEPVVPAPQDSGTAESQPREAENQEPHERQTPAAQGPVILAQDSFDGKLGLGWYLFNPLASHWSLSKKPGTLTITTHAGTFTRERMDYKNLFLLDCPAAPGQDFQVTTCLVSFQPGDLWNQAGLILWNNVDDFLTLVYEWGEGPPELGQSNQRMFTACVETEGRPVFSWYYAPQDQERVWLRVARRTNRFELSTSKDGETFTPLSPMRARGVANNVLLWGNGAVRRVGLFANDGSAPEAKPVDASFDLFEVRAWETKREAETPSSFQLSDLVGTWSWLQGPWRGDFVLQMDGNSCRGTLNDVHEGTYGDRIVDVVISGNHITFRREGTFGIQRWEGTLKKEDGTLKIVDGKWRKEGRGTSGSFIAQKESPGDTSGQSTGQPEAQTAGAINLGPNVNSDHNEGSPDISADGMTLYFDALVRPGGIGGWDIWMSRAQSPHNDFAPAIALAALVNSRFNETGPCISDDGLTLYFASDRPGGSGDFDLWVTTRTSTDDPWGEPVNLGPTVNSRYYDNHPSISADGLTLYFDSRRPGIPGHSGHNDIYMVKRAAVNDAWGEPEPLAVNTEEHEYSPDITPDGLTLYYDSFLAGRDLWVSKRATQDAAWEKGLPLDAPFNTPGIDTDPSISVNSSLLYFVSDRPEGYGAFDIWVIDTEKYQNSRAQLWERVAARNSSRRRTPEGGEREVSGTKGSWGQPVWSQ
jgi:regulation of enolase protein 1 (concanavalin A-like superfamily)